MSTSESDLLEEDRKLRVQINEKDLLCINGCGFYGTPQWGNRCSKCWRAHQIAEKRNIDYARNRTLLAFDRFEEKRKLSSDSRSLTLRNIIKKSPSMFTSSESTSELRASPNGTPSRHGRALSPDSSSARVAFTDWLVGNVPTPVVQEVTKMTKFAEHKIHEFDIAADDMSELVQNFYQHLNDRLNHNKFFQNQESVEVQSVMEEVERYLSVVTYNRLFCPTADEEVGDLSLQERIRSLNWVTAGFLETKLDFKRAAVRDSLDEALTECLSINSPRKIDEKLGCIVRCCHRIFDALRNSAAPTSADEFLPVLIYILLKGNPPLLMSNVKYISRYALPHRIMSGESGYFFTNLSCALQFVQDMNHDSLKMAQTEFEAYTSGQIQPPPSAANCGCNQAIASMEQSLSHLEKLELEQKKLADEMEALGKTVAKMEEEIESSYGFLDDYPTKELQDLLEKVDEEEKKTFQVCNLTAQFQKKKNEAPSQVPNNDAVESQGPKEQ
ncbi:unnamed protein product, partial [Mesorhabditis belari]|uniref:Rab5 GDP/GTP exchange factor n=1 Tax=Mesorhabditis belari TaxID=2138241 RepID=A0AAF3J1Z6_9BILA